LVILSHLAKILIKDCVVNPLENYMFQLKETLDRLPLELIEVTVERLHQARLQGRQIFIIGNGGSAATATHLACDLGKNTVCDHAPRFRVMALTDNMAVFSALANDLGYENVFAEQLANFIQPDDIVLAISASGNSPNILKAIQLARHHDAFTMGWSGYEGGKLAKLVEMPIVVPNHCIEQIEDIHLMLAHMVTSAVRQMGLEIETLPVPVALGGLHGHSHNGGLHIKPLPRQRASLLAAD
jgi:D-sedoheptulose 7-phosphate isomerase